ncbi:MAG: PP0621 family protein [Gammaproteobacteria bacterium]|nr:PP0621 family protein [Gammaproteobacteria bacterium]
MLIRNLFILIIILLAIWILRILIKKSSTAQKQTSTDSKKMVQCKYCKVYLPLDDAIKTRNTYFCSQQHLEDWETGSNHDDH